MRPKSYLILVTLCALAIIGHSGWCAEESRTALDAAKALVGSYQGAWTLYGLDEQGRVVARAAWEDTVEAKEPRQEKGRAFVSITNVLTFSGGKSFTVNFVEGYLVNRDGTAGSRYFDLQGHTGPFIAFEKKGP